MLREFWLMGVTAVIVPSDHLKSSASQELSEKMQLPKAEEQSRKTATKKMRVQMVHGFRSKK